MSYQLSVNQCEMYFVLVTCVMVKHAVLCFSSCFQFKRENFQNGDKCHATTKRLDFFLRKKDVLLQQC